MDYPPLTGSEIWKRKIRTAFKGLDANDDGYITEEDFIIAAQRAAQYLGLTDEETEPMLNIRREVWKGMSSNSQTTKISEEEHIKITMSIFNESKFRLETYPRIVLTGFDVMDIDGDGRISKREFAAFFYGMNVPAEYSKDVFDVLDENKDGFISFEEYAQGHVEFWFGEDPNSKYNEFLGPLVQ
ncbi:luciferin-binding protein-like [Lingula anatina]|uniref:Luciferin-binding protein-like n=1 Tax=Lingula anatina TaxID=7574 RepID=A0A1S3I2D1_LINAN|nr:luciferin-binding protein-like [Lingula anatina]|eukprot:XP_013392427.1 luciferin-binding protein-like [Lingula anatina]